MNVCVDAKDPKNWLCCPLVKKKSNNALHVVQKHKDIVLGSFMIEDSKENEIVISQWSTFVQHFSKMIKMLNKINKDFEFMFSSLGNEDDAHRNKIQHRYNELCSTYHLPKKYRFDTCKRICEYQWFARIHSFSKYYPLSTTLKTSDILPPFYSILDTCTVTYLKNILIYHFILDNLNIIDISLICLKYNY